MAQPSPLVLVVGMHRSGTSLLGGLLQRLGVSLPGDTIAGDQHNPEGYFEWDAVVAIQERLLIDLERWWPALEGTQALPEGWLEHPATLQARQQLRTLLATESERQTSLWAIKDPRCSRLLPLWIALARELAIPLQLLLAVRDPAEVTASLLRRDGPLTGMDANRAQQLWWRHNLEVVHAARGAGLPLAVVDFSRWFEAPEAQLQQLNAALKGLNPSAQQWAEALALIEPDHRRSLGQADPQVLDPAVRRLHARLLLQPLPRRLPPPQPPARLVRDQLHPVAATALEADPSSWPHWLERHCHFPAPRVVHPPALAGDPQLHVCGFTWMDLEPHLLLQRAPLQGLAGCEVDPQRSQTHQLRLRPHPGRKGELTTLAFNLELPPPDRAAHWLAHLRAQQLILDPDPARVLLLRALGLPAWWLDPQAPVNGWLEQPGANTEEAWARLLGLVPPTPGALILLGSAGAEIDRALAAEAAAATRPDPAIHYCPGWPELIVTDAETGLARAGWLQAAARRGARLVACSVSSLPGSWSRLEGLQAEPWCLPACSTPADLRALHRGAPLRVLAEDRPSPPQDTLFQWSGDQPPAAAVVVSLFNYAERISDALDSVAAQSCDRLELIVVDDASSDAGAEQVVAWMNACLGQAEHPFMRLLLLRHTRNAGLATARNTAFAAAQAPWCFVLDADNALYPQALGRCLEHAQAGGPQLAVVHPLLAVEAEPGRPDDQRSLVRPQSWQQSRFRFENNVDAMALVRRSAWEAVGGYTHIEGGWEDYDFWCKLSGAGFHGLQCPEVLAVYRSHADSMSHTATNRSWRALSRTLQDRHPWLDLPLATP